MATKKTQKAPTIKKTSSKKKVKKEEPPIDSFEMDEVFNEDKLEETLPEENGYVDDAANIADVLKRNKNN